MFFIAAILVDHAARKGSVMTTLLRVKANSRDLRLTPMRSVTALAVRGSQWPATARCGRFAFS
jgi:hypothetical protein